jgi:hypothetical protein
MTFLPHVPYSPGTDLAMSEPDENAPKTGTKPLLDAARRAAQPKEETGGHPKEPKPAGQEALEQALSESGKDLEDLT